MQRGRQPDKRRAGGRSATRWAWTSCRTRGGAKTRHQQDAGSWPARRHLRLLGPGRFQRAQKGDDRIEIGGRDPLVPSEGHRAAEVRAVWADAIGNGALDLRIGPVADAVLRAGGDIAADGDPAGVVELGPFAAAEISEAHVVRFA